MFYDRKYLNVKRRWWSMYELIPTLNTLGMYTFSDRQLAHIRRSNMDSLLYRRRKNPHMLAYMLLSTVSDYFALQQPTNTIYYANVQIIYV